MPTWLPPTTAEQPSLILTNWLAFEVLIPRLGSPTLHIAGWAADEGGGRVSSPVVSIDERQCCVVTRSGRVYALHGEPSDHPDVAYLVQQWTEGFNATLLRIATQEVQKRFHAGPPRDG